MKRSYRKTPKPINPYLHDPDRVMSRGDVAILFGVSKTRVDQISKTGVLRRVMLPGLSRSLGYVTSEVRALLAKRQEAT